VPAALKRIGTNADGEPIYRLMTKCDVCDAPYPGFGYNVSLSEAMRELGLGRKAAAKARLGQWRCAEHRKD